MIGGFKVEIFEAIFVITVGAALVIGAVIFVEITLIERAIFGFGFVVFGVFIEPFETTIVIDVVIRVHVAF